MAGQVPTTSWGPFKIDLNLGSITRVKDGQEIPLSTEAMYLVKLTAVLGDLLKPSQAAHLIWPERKFVSQEQIGHFLMALVAEIESQVGPGTLPIGWISELYSDSKERLREASQAVIRIGSLTIDRDQRQALLQGDRVPLTPTELLILTFLAEKVGKVVAPNEILNAVRPDYSHSAREAQESVKVYIRRIRRKIESNGAAPEKILNVRGFGYMLDRRGFRIPGPQKGRQLKAS